MNKRTINPDAMYLHIALRSGHEEADRICPLVPDASAKPPVADCDPYCMAGSTPCRKCRERAAASAKPAMPATPADDEDFVYVSDTEVGISGCLNLSAAAEIIEKQAKIIRELRNNTCGGAAPDLAAPSTEGCRAELKPLGTGPAPAADPRRLTSEEIDGAWCAAATLGAANRAVADAQLTKAQVTISEEEIVKLRWVEGSIRIPTLIALLRSKGVEVTQ